MLSFPSQNEKIFFPTGRVYSKKQTWVTANQYVFKSGLKKNFCFPEKKMFLKSHCTSLIGCIMIMRGYQLRSTANTTTDIYLPVTNDKAPASLNRF